MHFEIIPFEGVGDIKFGMSRKQVRDTLKADYVTRKRTSKSVFPYDFFQSLGIFANYKIPEILEAVELILPCIPEFEGLKLLEISYKELKEFLLAKDSNLEVNLDGFISGAIGIGAYAPDADEDPDLPVEAILVFDKDYYDKRNKTKH